MWDKFYFFVLFFVKVKDFKEIYVSKVFICIKIFGEKEKRDLGRKG